MKHTPAPWTVTRSEFQGSTELRISPTTFRANFHTTTNPKFAERDAEVAANAALIAAAPDLLAALIDAADALAIHAPDSWVLIQARAFIAKAGGAA